MDIYQESVYLPVSKLFTLRFFQDANFDGEVTNPWSKLWAWNKSSSTFSFLSTTPCFSLGKCSFQFTNMASAFVTAGSRFFPEIEVRDSTVPIMRIRSMR